MRAAIRAMPRACHARYSRAARISARLTTAAAIGRQPDSRSRSTRPPVTSDFAASPTCLRPDSTSSEERGARSMESLFEQLLHWLRLAVEASAAFWIAIGFAYAFVELVAAHLRREIASFKDIRLTFSRYLSLALEFQLAGDILSTAIAPTFDELAKLAITAVIRTALNYFLSKEIRETREDRERELRVAARTETTFPAGARPAQA